MTGYFKEPLTVLVMAMWAAVMLLGLCGPNTRAITDFRGEPAPSSNMTEPPLLAPVVSHGGSRVQGAAPSDFLSRVVPESIPEARVFTHVVKPGEALSLIARRYGTDVESILAANQIMNEHMLRAGQKLRIPSMKGLLHTMRAGESLENVARQYKTPLVKIMAANKIVDPANLEVGREIIIPDAAKPRPTVRRIQLASRGGLRFIWPVRGWLTSRFGIRWGRLHEGIDIAVPYGQRVVSAAAGQVVYAGWRAKYGLMVSIDHGNGVITRYGHNSKLLVTVGQQVEGGEPIALSGSTGTSTGPHLHFEVRVWNRPEDPLAWLR